MAQGSSLRWSSGLAGFQIPGAKILPSVSSNALTIKITHPDGSDPSATNPLYVAFPSDPTSGALFEGRHITSALSLTLGNGSNLATANNTPFRIWLVLFDDDGVLRLGTINCFTGVVLFPLTEGIASSTAEGGGAATLAGTFYTTTAVTSKPYRIIGYLEWTSGLASAGAWSLAPDLVQMHSIAGKLPGDIVQEYAEETSASSNNAATTIPFDGTIPQLSEGDLLIQIGADFTPKSKANRLIVEASCHISYSVATKIAMALFKNLASTPTANADAVAWSWDTIAADTPMRMQMLHIGRTLYASPLVFVVQVGGNTAGTIYFNSNSAATGLGGRQIRIIEIQG